MLLRLYTLLFITGMFLLPGCMAKHDPYLAADQVAENSGWQKEIIRTVRFDLITYHRLQNTRDALTIYLEGDGNAWRSRYSLSPDPTPMNTLVLELAAMDQSPGVAYIARPCQYVIESKLNRNCDSQYWSQGRFSAEVVSTLDEAISSLKQRAGASRIHLIGYSGGGALAILVAAKRDDIASLRTIGGNLDHVAFTNKHKVTPLSESLNPINFAPHVSRIPQIHFSGSKDRVVPVSIAERFIASLGEQHCAELIRVKGAKHSKGWRKVWPGLLEMTPKCK